MAEEKSDFLKKIKTAFGRPLVLIILLFILVNLFLISRYLSSRQKLIPQVQKPTAEEELPLWEDKIPQATQSSTAGVRPLPQGKVGFTVGQADKKAPLMGRGFIDPYDPKPGEKQTVSINVKDKVPVRSVAVTLKTDNSSKKYNMDLVEGTELEGRWEASWMVDDTHDHTYHAILETVGEKGSTSVDITLR